MSRSFHGSTESTATVDQIHAAFGREDYWLDRLATGGAVTLDSLVVRADDTVAACYTQHLGRGLLPATVARFVPGDISMRYSETWQPAADGRVRGQIGVSVSANLGSCTATTWLAPTPQGSELRFEGKVAVKLPLVGGNLEKAIGADLAANIPSVLSFTTTWIAAHP
jgi:hypothetical protein